MRRKNITLLCLITTCMILLCLKTTTIQAASTDTTTDADIAEKYEKKDTTEYIISYVVGKDKELILKVSDNKVLDLEALKKEIGEKNVKLENDNKEITLTLDDPNRNTFKLMTNNKLPASLSVSDTDGKNIFDYDINPVEMTRNEDDDDSSAEEATWTETPTMRLSEGPILKHDDGTTTKNYLYFGDYRYAEHNQLVSLSYEAKGKTRINSLTAPNSAVLFAAKGSRIEDGKDAPQNHLYTSHYGDAQDKDTPLLALEPEFRPMGSPNSFTANNLYNFVNKTDDWLRPGTSGPDKLGQSYSMLSIPKLYYRKNPQTGFEEQKIVFKQRAFEVNKKDRANPEITTTIKQSFNNAGNVITHFSFKNTGKYNFNNFSGFSNHDFSLNKDGKELEMTRNRKTTRIGNYVPMYALGQERGMYMQSTNNEMRTSVYVNGPDGPGAWAARSIGHSFIATKGYMHTPGLLEIASTRERYFPWKIGKEKFHSIGTSTKFYDKKNDRMISPYVPLEDNSNAFNNQRDPGDKSYNLVAGARLGMNVKEGQKRIGGTTWDSGLTMRTAPQDLPINGTVEMEYMTKNDIKGTSFNPVLEIDKKGTMDDPKLYPLDTKNIYLHGQWYDFDNRDVTPLYKFDDEPGWIYYDRTQFSQREADMLSGKHHEVDYRIDLSHMENHKKGKHVLHMALIDGDGNYSGVEDHYFKLVKESTNEPTIEVTSPNNSEKKPYNPFDHQFKVTGIWSDKDSKKIKQLSYQIDNEEEKVFQKDLDNNIGKFNSWDIQEFDIKDFNDLKLHKVTFKIIDIDGNEGTDVLYFQHAAGNMRLVAPEEIDFGTVNVTPTTVNPIKPKFNDEKVYLDDFREKDSNPVGVSLSIDKFYKDNTPVDNGDDGDDGDLDPDPDPEPDKKPNTREEAPESLVHDVYWHDKLADGNNLLVGETSGPKNAEWLQTTDFTKQILKNLKINFRSSENGSSSGKYISHWTWQTVDSVQ